MRLWQGFAAAMAAVALAASTPAPSATDQIVAAERAFAVDGLAHGIRDSFPRHAAPNAIMFAPDVVDVHQFFAAQPPEPANPNLDWWPVFAGAARSGDLGFTTGVASSNGRTFGFYFTMWRRQADGRWLWEFDGGSGASTEGAPAKGSEVARLSASVGGARSAAAAMAQVRAAEAALAAEARTAQAPAFAARLALDGRVYVQGQPPAAEPAQHARALAAWPASFDFGPVAGGGASRAGDMVWVYGDARWRQGGSDHTGRYVHLWQHRANGWRIVFAQIIERRG